MNKDPWRRRKALYDHTPTKKTESKRKRLKFRLFPILWVALKRTCTFVGAVVLFSSLIVSWSFSSVVEEQDTALPSQMVLHLQLDGQMSDLPKSVSFIDPFSDEKKTTKNMIDAIYRAKDDPRVDGIYATLEQGGYSVTHVQELRQAIKDFRKSGKFAYIYAASYAGGLGNYYLATAFDEIWMQPMGIVMITGLNAEMPFARDALDKIGVKPEFFQRKKYKNAYESFTASQMSDANREATTALVNDIASVISEEVAQDIKITPAQFKSLVDRGLFLDQESLDNGLITHLEYQDEIFKQINKAVYGDEEIEADYVKFGSYIGEMLKQKKHGSDIFKHKDNKPRVALIYAVGAIMDTDENSKSSAPSVMVDDGVAAADEISEALLSAADDDTIEAVVLRVDSPGGSPVASETILRAIERVKKSDKIVIVSMGSAAASGGYWISAYADHIIAQPTTITGSIGVLGGKISTEQLWENLGVHWENVQWGDKAQFFSMNKSFSPAEEERMNAMLDNVYVNFVDRVSKGRGMTKEEVDKIAGGRVWSGKSAIKVGLVDQLGGMNDALDYAAVELGQEGRNDIDVVVLPKPLSPIEQLVQLLEGQVYAGRVIGAQAKMLEQFAPKVQEFMIMQDAKTNSVYSPLRVE